LSTERARPDGPACVQRGDCADQHCAPACACRLRRGRLHLRANVRPVGHGRTEEKAREPDWLVARLTNTPGSDLLSHAAAERQRSGQPTRRTHPACERARQAGHCRVQERPALRCLSAAPGHTPGSDRLSHAPPEPPGGGVASAAARTLRANVRAVPSHCRTRRKAGARFQAPASGRTPGSDLLSHATAGAARRRRSQHCRTHPACERARRARSLPYTKKGRCSFPSTGLW
jgi:hypothetical protein